MVNMPREKYTRSNKGAQMTGIKKKPDFLKPELWRQKKPKPHRNNQDINSHIWIVFSSKTNRHLTGTGGKGRKGEGGFAQSQATASHRGTAVVL